MQSPIQPLAGSSRYSVVDGILVPLEGLADQRAAKRWQAESRTGVINAAAATTSRDLFAKLPQFVLERCSSLRGRLLDAGCGYGRVAIPLAQANPNLEIVALDASMEMLAEFRHLLSATALHSLQQRICLIQSNLLPLPFEDGAFDAVMSCGVLLHNPKPDVRCILNEFKRVLRAGGSLILASSFPNLANLEGLQNYVYQALPWNRNRNGPVRSYSLGELKKLFSAWKRVEILPSGVSLIPRSIAKVRLPFGAGIRSLNAAIEKRDLQLIKHSGVLARQFEVCAAK